MLGNARLGIRCRKGPSRNLALLARFSRGEVLVIMKKEGLETGFWPELVQKGGALLRSSLERAFMRGAAFREE